MRDWPEGEQPKFAIVDESVEPARWYRFWTMEQLLEWARGEMEISQP